MTKLERLLRFHRHHVFDPCEVVADRHERALKRLKRTKAFAALCEASRNRQDQIKSDRLLRMWQ